MWAWWLLWTRALYPSTPEERSNVCTSATRFSQTSSTLSMSPTTCEVIWVCFTIIRPSSAASWPGRGCEVKKSMMHRHSALCDTSISWPLHVCDQICYIWGYSLCFSYNDQTLQMRQGQHLLQKKKAMFYVFFSFHFERERERAK